jgi:ribosomal protein S18 acetylase RimI-like enzyme
LTAAYHQVIQRESGLRMANPHRDMGQIAKLIELVFGDTLDQSGRRMVRDMRRMGELGWLGWAVSLLWLPSVARLTGFVWEEDGQVVGNLGLTPVDRSPERWVMANIAVHPDHRRRGIGKALVQAGLQRAEERGGTTVLLQVDSENRHAQELYAAEGFHPITIRSTWRRSPDRGVPLGIEPGPVRHRTPSEWRDQLQLARQIHPEGVVWPHPIQPSLFRPNFLGGLLGLEYDKHWVWMEDDRLLGSLSLQHGVHPRSYRIILLVQPEQRGHLEVGLLSRAFDALPLDVANLVLDYPADTSEEIFVEFGFRKERSLTWMQIQLGKG